MTPPLPEAVARLTESANGENQLTLGRNVFVQTADLKLILTTHQAMVEEKASLERERDALKREAEMWAGEARCHKSSLHEAYQAVTGATGEPGNWNGARPIIDRLNALQSALAEALVALGPFVKVSRLITQRWHGETKVMVELPTTKRVRPTTYVYVEDLTRASELHSRLSNGLGLHEGAKDHG